MDVRRFLLCLEHLLVPQPKHVPLIKVDISLGHKSRCGVTSDDLPIPDLHKYHNVLVFVNVRVERLIVFGIEFIQEFGRFNFSFYILLKIDDEPFDHFAVGNVQNMAVEVLKVLARWVFYDVFVLINGFLSLDLCILEVFLLFI